MIVARLTTVKGNCTIPGYDKPDDRWFVVDEVSFGFSQDHVETKNASDGGRDMVVGRREETTINISKAIDSATCDLMYQAMSDRFAAKGAHSSTPVKADIHFIETLAHDVIANKQGKSSSSGVIAYLRIAMETVKVKSWSISGTSEGKPTEEFVLWCEQLAMRYQRTVDGRIYKDAGLKGWNQQLGLQGSRDWKPDKSNKYFDADYYPQW